MNDLLDTPDVFNIYPKIEETDDPIRLTVTEQYGRHAVDRFVSNIMSIVAYSVGAGIAVCVFLYFFA